MERKIARQYINNRTFLVQEEPRGPSQLVEIPVTTNGLSEINLPDVPNLRNMVDQTIIIKAIRVIPPTVLTNAPLTGFAVSPLTELVKCNILIYCEGWQKGKNIPLASLIDIFTEGSGIPWKNHTTQFANWENVDWNKTIIQYSNGTVSAGVNYAFVLEVEYVKLNKDGEEIVGPS